MFLLVKSLFNLSYYFPYILTRLWFSSYWLTLPILSCLVLSLPKLSSRLNFACLYAKYHSVISLYVVPSLPLQSKLGILCIFYVIAFKTVLLFHLFTMLVFQANYNTLSEANMFLYMTEGTGWQYIIMTI